MTYMVLWGSEDCRGIKPHCEETNSLKEALNLAALLSGTILDARDQIVADFSEEAA